MKLQENIDGTNQNFLSLFKIQKYPKYFNTVPFNKGFGFSVKRKYNTNIHKILPKEEDGNYQYLALFHIFIEDDELTRPNARKIIGIRVAMVVGKEKLMFPNNPKNNWPAELISDDYSFDFETDKFYKNEREIDPMHILEQMYEAHVKPCKKIKGLWFRTKKRLQFSFAKLLKFISQLLNCFLFITNGKTETWKFEKRFWEYSTLTKKEGTKTITQSEKVKFLGFEVSKQCLFLYCLLHLILFLIIGESTNFVQILKNWHLFNFGKSTLANPFFSVAYAFVSLTIFEAILEKLLPAPIQYLVKKTTLWAKEIEWRRIKI